MIPKINTISLEMTTVCPLKCPACPTGLGLIKPEIQEIKNSRNIIDKIINELNPKKVSFTGQGEPLTNLNIVEHINKLQENNIKVNIDTTLNVNNCVINNLLSIKNPCEINVSIPGISEKTYLLYKKNGNWNLLFNNIKQLKDKHKLNMQFILHKKNKHELKNLRNFAKSHGFYTFSIRELSVIHNIDMFESFKIDFIKDDDCVDILNNPFISTDGSLFPCCAFRNANYINFGNIFENSFKDLYSSKEFMKFKSEVEQNTFQCNNICKECLGNLSSSGEKIFRLR